jgi:hypothetical protein
LGWPGARRPSRPRGPRPWLLKPRARRRRPVGVAAEQGFFKNLVAVTSSNLNVALEDSKIWQMAQRTPPGGFKGFATRAARAAHAGPRATAQMMTSPAVYTCSFSRKAVLRPGTAMAAMMTAHVSYGRESRAFLAILEPERQGLPIRGVSWMTRGQGHQTNSAGKCARAHFASKWSRPSHRPPQRRPTLLLRACIHHALGGETAPRRCRRNKEEREHKKEEESTHTHTTLIRSCSAPAGAATHKTLQPRKQTYRQRIGKRQQFFFSCRETPP